MKIVKMKIAKMRNNHAGRRFYAKEQFTSRD